MDNKNILCPWILGMFGIFFFFGVFWNVNKEKNNKIDKSIEVPKFGVVFNELFSGDQCFFFLFPAEEFELQEPDLDLKTAFQNYVKLRLPHQ